MKRRLLPLLLFVALAGLLAAGLGRDPRAIPSPLVGRPAPDFRLSELDGAGLVSPQRWAGEVVLLNVWASWCGACREEHPVLMGLREEGLTIYGLDYKDDRGAALAVLKEEGNPYRAVAFDGDGRVGIDYGVYGVPESYLIDRRGAIRFKRIGPLTPEVVQGEILPLWEALRRETP